MSTTTTKPLAPIVKIGGHPARHFTQVIDKLINVGRMAGEPEFTFRPREIYRVFQNKKWRWKSLEKKV